MKIKTIKAALHRFEVRVPLLKKPLHRQAVVWMAGLMNGWRVEFHLDMQAVGEMMFVNPPRPVNNIVKIPGEPGLGLKPNRGVLRDTLVKA